MVHEETTETPWWKRTTHGFTFDAWLKLWNTELSLDARFWLLDELPHAFATDGEFAPHIRHLIGLFDDIQAKGGPNHAFSQITLDVAAKAAEIFVSIALGEYDAGASYAHDPSILPAVLGILSTHSSYFDDQKKKLRHKVKQGLKWLYGPGRQTRDEAARVINANLPVLIQCVCEYGLFDIIEETDDLTLTTLEWLVKKRYGGAIDLVALAYDTSLENSKERQAARHLLYLRGKYEHQKAKATST